MIAVARPLPAAPARPALACCLAALAGLILTTLTYAPGQMNVDALIQLEQARSLDFNDYHPPLMGRLWAIFLLVLPGPIGMLLFHNLLFWTGLGLIAYLERLSPTRSALFILGVGLFPPLFSALGTIWKDVGLGAALLLAFALFRYAQRRSSRPALVLGLLSLFYGFAVRHNAAPAVLPLAVWAGVIAARLLSRQGQPPVWPGLLIGLAVFASLGGLVQVVNRALSDGNHTYPSQQVILHDLTAISLSTGTIYLPEELVLRDGPITLDKLACVYSPEQAWRVYNGNQERCSFRLKKVGDDRRFASVIGLWLTAVSRHPAAYLEHRWSVFREQFALTRDRVCYPLQIGLDPDLPGFEFRRSPLYDPALKATTAVAYLTPLFRGWVYLGLAAALVLLGPKLPPSDRWPALVLGSSGLAYGLSHLVVSPGCEFRYHWWLVVAALVVLGLSLARLRPRETPASFGNHR